MPTAAALYHHHNASTVTADERSKSQIKKQLRDLQRLLSRDNLFATVRQEKERQLKALQIALAEKNDAEKIAENIKKYRMVRFFERKKAERKLRQAYKSLKACDREDPRHEDLKNHFNCSRAELNYIVHFPSSEKYISLYPKTTITDENQLKKRDAVLADIDSKVSMSIFEDAYVHLLEKNSNSSCPEPVDREEDDEDEDDEDDEDTFDEDEDDEGFDGEEVEGGDDGSDSEDDEGDNGADENNNNPNNNNNGAGEEEDDDDDEESDDDSEEEDDEGEEEGSDEFDDDDDEEETEDDQDFNLKRKSHGNTMHADKKSRH